MNINEHSRKFFIGFTLPKHANEVVNVISDDLYDTFGIRKWSDKYPPHITLKAPFTGLVSNRESLIVFLKRFTTGRRDIGVDLNGFGHFNIGVIYCDVLQYTNALTQLKTELCDGLQQEMPWVSFKPEEPNGNPHITVAQEAVNDRFRDIYLYLKKRYRKSEHLILKEIHLFEKEPNKRTWNSVASFKLKPSL